jgi:hypothetical protein
MYDRPEIRGATDRLWAAVRAGLEASGIASPAALDRERPPAAVWTDPGLVLSQACGLPLATWLAGRVAYVATPTYALEGCPPGHYRSAVVVAEESPAGGLPEMRGARPAINARDSQSGHAALMRAAAPHARDGRFFGPALETGAHAASMEAVAAGAADLAAIDTVAWALARREGDRAAAGLRVLAWTAPAPALPLITAPGRDPTPIRDAVAGAIGALSPADRAALMIEGIVVHPPEAYAALATRLSEAERIHRLPSA